MSNKNTNNSINYNYINSTTRTPLHYTIGFLSALIYFTSSFLLLTLTLSQLAVHVPVIPLLQHVLFLFILASLSGLIYWWVYENCLYQIYSLFCQNKN